MEYQDLAIKIAGNARYSFREIRKSSTGARNQALLNLAEVLRSADGQQRILEANSVDLEAGKESGLTTALLDRLKLDPDRIASMAAAAEEIARSSDPLGEVIRGNNLANGVAMLQKRVPLGVVFTVYESRPNVTIDVGALCLKAGNAAILRGGKEAIHSNTALYRIFRDAVEKAGLPGHSIQLVEETDRQCMLALLQQNAYIDIVVPRGGEGLIQYVSENTRIPVVKHDKGVCNLYIDFAALPDLASTIAINAKLQRPSVCNAIENLIIHKDFPGIPALLESLRQAGAELLGCERTRELYPSARSISDPDEEYGKEYLDNRLAVKIVASIEEATDFIYKYGSGHSEAIVSENRQALDFFQSSVDCAAIFLNCSTRFHDGGQMGMGAEVGISTGRLHVRGPMGLHDLTTTTYIMTGSGQIR